MKTRHKLRLLAAATACLMALLPVISMADEQTGQATAQITKTCTTPAQDIKPGSTIQFQINIKVTGGKEETIDDSLLTDTWDEGLTMEGTPTVSEGFNLVPGETGTNWASYTVETTYEEEFIPGLIVGDELTITCNMKVSENASGKLNNEVKLTGKRLNKDYEVSANKEITVVTDTPAPEDTPKADKGEDAKATLDESPKTGDGVLPWWLFMVMEKLGL